MTPGTATAASGATSGGDGDRLRTGLTTGVCATAAASAAADLALAGHRRDSAAVGLPRGQRTIVGLRDLARIPGGARAGVIKDAGDDPDATHGARVWATVIPESTPGVRFHAGTGVGTVTRAGLPVPPGEPAINPVPRRMIDEHLVEVATACDYAGGFGVTVGVDDGERISERTMNPRLGIVGGISILGTTGIVRPFSCAAYIASIHQGIDVARAAGCRALACCTGGTSEDAARRRYGLDSMALIEMGDLFGAVLKYLRRHTAPSVALVAGFGKLSKFADGHLDTHSRKCRVDLDALAADARALGADDPVCDRIRAGNTALDALAIAHAADLPLGQRVCTRARQQAHHLLPDVELEVCAVDRAGHIVGTAANGTAAP